MQEMRVWSLGREDPLEKGMATHSSILGLENPMHRGAWWATGTKSWIQLINETTTVFKVLVIFTFTCSLTSLSLFTFMHWRRKWQPTPVFLAWRIPGTEEPGRGSHRVGHDWSDLAAAYYKNFKTIYSKFFLLILCAFVVMQTYNTFIHVKVMANLDSILKSRDITLLTKVRLVKAMVFPVVMYGCESWTIKKAECWIIDAFEL